MRLYLPYLPRHRPKDRGLMRMEQNKECQKDIKEEKVANLVAARVQEEPGDPKGHVGVAEVTICSGIVLTPKERARERTHRCRPHGHHGDQPNSLDLVLSNGASGCRERAKAKECTAWRRTIGTKVKRDLRRVAKLGSAQMWSSDTVGP